MKRRVFALCVTLSLLLGLLPAAARAAEDDFVIVNGVLRDYTGHGGHVVIPDGVTSIGWKSFEGRTDLISVFIPSGVTDIDRYAFRGCSRLVNVTIPASVTNIAEDAFSGTPWLENGGDFVIINGILIKYNGAGGAVTIPGNVTRIGVEAFINCTALASVTIPTSVTSIGTNAFSGCTELAKVTIPDGVVEIASFAFSDCEKLINVNIPGGVTYLDNWIFSGCSSLMSITVDKSNQRYKDVDGVLFDKRAKSLILYPSGKEGAFYIIPDDVDYIVDDAFSGCTKLTRIVIPDTVTMIGNRTFENCENLSDVTLPKSALIGQDVFSGCTSLTNIALPEGETSIDGTFRNCTNLTSVIIPNSVMDIGQYAFDGCSSLASVIIPNSVTGIGMSAFKGCSNLSSIIIPNGVTAISSFAFSDCTNLTSISIPQGITHIEYAAFWQCNSLNDIYYGGDEDQWAEIETEGANDVLKRATIHYNCGAYKTLVSSGKYQIHVVNEKGKDIRGATVAWNSESQETTSKGIATFDLLTAGEPTVTVSKDGYLTWTNANSNWTKSPDHYETVILYPEALGVYKLASCRYSSSSTMTMDTDLLTTTKTVSLGNDISLAVDGGGGKFYLSCVANDPSDVDHYELWQGSQKVAQESVGFFSLSTDQFKDGGGCFVRVVSKDGDKVDTRINLQFKTAKLNKASSISWGGKSVNFKVDDNVPFLGGSTFTANLPIQLPITFLAGDDKLQIGLNVNVTGGKTEKEQLDKLRESIQRAKTARGLFESKQWEECKALIKEKNGFKFSRDGELNAIGYLEANWGSSTATGEIMIQYTIAPVEYGYTTLMPVPVIVAVPVTAKIKFSAEGAVVGAVSYNWNDATFLGTLDLDFKAALKAVGAIGTSDIGVGPYGSATLTGGYRLEGPTTGWKDIDLTGELGLTAYIFSSEIKKAFAYNTWHIYSSNTVKAASLMAADEHWKAGVFSAQDYHPQDLSYLAEESGWLGGAEDQAQLFAASGASTTLTPLLTDTYRNARPMMVAGPNGLYAAFLRADSASGDIYTVVTKYDGSAWATPIRVDSGSVLDSTPTLCVDDSGTLWLAYARTAAGVDKTSLSDYAQNQSIVVGTIDPHTLAFTKRAEFSGAGYAHMPQLAVIGGVPTLAWVDSPVTDDNSVLWPATATVYTSTWNGAAWGAAAAAETVDKLVTQLILGEKDGQRALAYVADEDGDATTQEDWNLYANGALTTQGVLGTVTLAQAPGMSSVDYMWNADGYLMAADGTQIPAVGISDEYAVTDNRIYYSAAGTAEQGGAHLTTVLYDDGTWSEAVTLTGGERYLEDLSVITWNGQDYLMGMDTLAEITETDVNDAKNLVWATVMPSSDLRLDGLNYSAEGLIAGENVAVTITVTNAGDHGVDSIDMALGDDHWTENCQLAPGESLDITHTVTCPSTLTDYPVSVVETDWEDFTPEDNTATLSLGYAQLNVELKEQRIGISQALVAVVTNTGIDSESGTLCFTNEAGEVLDEVELSTLAAGDSEIITYPAQLPNGDYTATLLCGEKSLYADDTDTIHVERYCEIISTQVADNTLTASVIGEAGATAYCAFYDVDGRMLQVVSEPLEAGAAEMSFPAPASANYGKVFLLSSQQFPLCPAVQISKDITTK